MPTILNDNLHLEHFSSLRVGPPSIERGPLTPLKECLHLAMFIPSGKLKWGIAMFHYPPLRCHTILLAAVSLRCVSCPLSVAKRDLLRVLLKSLLE